jgi:predicted heme/steroid binding protein
MKPKININNIIYQYQNEICYLKQMQVLSMSPKDKNYYTEQMNRRTEDIIMEINKFMVNAQDIDSGINIEEDNSSQLTDFNMDNQLNNHSDPNEQMEFTMEDLSNYDGSNGKAAYVAVNGNIYDMSAEVGWAGGTHFGLYAGNDLSLQFLGCHQGMIEILEKLPKVGTLKK